jgi:MscS family membrane protein
VFAYAGTRDWAEFLGIQEDVLLRVRDIVDQSGTALAFPSQTLYFTRDQGLDGGKGQDAEAQVRQWRDEGQLPFPNFSPEQMQRSRRRRDQ